MADGKLQRTMVPNLELFEAEIGFDVEGRGVESVAPRSIADGLFFTGDVILAVDGAEVSDDTVVCGQAGAVGGGDCVDAQCFGCRGW